MARRDEDRLRDEIRRQLSGFPREFKRQLGGFGREAKHQLTTGWGSEIARQLFGPPGGKSGRKSNRCCCWGNRAPRNRNLHLSAGRPGLRTGDDGVHDDTRRRHRTRSTWRLTQYAGYGICMAWATASINRS